MIGWLLLAVWLLVVPVASKIALTRITASWAYCHKEEKHGRSFRWPDKESCRRYCRAGCWRPDVDRTTFVNAVLASLIGLAWPLVLLPGWLYVSYHPLPRADVKRIRELERDVFGRELD